MSGWFAVGIALHGPQIWPLANAWIRPIGHNLRTSPGHLELAPATQRGANERKALHGGARVDAALQPFLPVTAIESDYSGKRTAACTRRCNSRPEGFRHFVSSMPAPVASGWSDVAGWALHPLESAAFPRRTPDADIASPLPHTGTGVYPA